MTNGEQQERIDVFVGIDVGKGAHHAVALDLSGKRLLDSALPNDEGKLRALITKLKEHGRVLLVVDQPATIGALPVAVARAEDVAVAYLRDLRCVVLPICTRARRRRMRATHTSSRKLRAACPIRCAR